MKQSLNKLFLYLGNDEKLPCNGGEDLFGFITEDSPALPRHYEQTDIDLVAAVFSGGFDISIFDEPARVLYELSVNAFDAIIHAWMSELPIEAEILSFGRGVIAAGKGADSGIAARRAAERAAADRGRADTCAVLAAAYKVQREFHRMMGFLRFSPNDTGVFTARCAPDHFVLPALGDYLTARFGETAWAVIDEKRGLCLRRIPGKDTLPRVIDRYLMENHVKKNDDWEELWRHYHKIINNESRDNPNLQRQFMPKRYWKYLPEVM